MILTKKGVNMSIETQKLERLQQELKYAYKWMARASEYAQKGQFNGSGYAITVALQRWMNCQHYQDTFENDDVYTGVDWKFFSEQAISMAKKELKEEQ